MAIVSADSRSTIRPLGREVSQEILGQSVRTAAPIEVGLESCREMRTGRFESHSGVSLVLLLTASASDLPSFAAGDPLRVTFDDDRGQYHFDTRCLSMSRTDRGHELRVKTPERLMILERRRSARRVLRRSTRVTLITGKDGGDAGVPATLLNVSTEGLACMTKNSLAELLATGQSLRVRFGLDGDDKNYDFPSRVVNITAGGTNEQCVVGLEFLVDEHAVEMRRRLQDALTSDRADGLERLSR